jgi:cytosine/adenosine deaminase-related metal-dependent hydrolase
LAEGIDAKSRSEFETLKQKNLLRKETAIIHGTAFEESEFEAMGKAGAKLIWSPMSNLVLYDKTTNIPLALKHGVSVSLGVDWNPSGSNNIFDELRVAAQVNQEEFAGAIPQSEWVRMITVNPAAALALETKLGRLAPGLKADITVVRRRHDDPNASLLLNSPQDVQMVWVGGDLLYSNRTALEKLKPNKCEPITVHGSRKRICVAKDGDTPLGNQTLNQIRNMLLGKYSGLAPLTPP